MESLPEKIGGCRIVAKLGQGGMGAVYRAIHETLGREVAIKLLPLACTQNAEYVQRFLREARAAAQLQHCNVVQVYDAGEQGGQYYISMELVDGTSMAHRLLSEGTLSEQEALGYLVQAARGLAAAHARGLIHRDIKPENLLINRENTLKIADFGLVTASASDSAGLTQAGAMLGTPLYMSPEQGDGLPADSRSDLYSLGVTFFRALTGTMPYSAPSPIGIIYKHKYEPTPDPKTLKPGLAPASAQLLLKLMAKNPEERFQSADEVARTAEALLAQMQTGQVPAELPVVAPGPKPVSGAMAAIDGAYAPTITPARGQPGVATVLPQPAIAVATPPPIYAQQPPQPHPITPPPPGQVYTPVPQAQYTPAGMPVYAPTPGMQAQGMTPAPAAPKSKAPLILGVAAMLLVLAAGGGFLGYRYYRAQQVVDAKQKAELLRTAHDYEKAIAGLEVAFAEHPEAPELKTLRDSIEAQWVNERVGKLKGQAQQYREDRNYAAEAKAYQDAQELLAAKDQLPGVDADPTLAERQKKAENLNHFTRFMDEGRAAEKEGRFDVAEKAYREAVKFEAKGEDTATQAAAKAQFKGYVQQADAMEASRNYPEALKLLDQAAALKVEDVSRKQESLRNAMEHLRLVGEATKAQEAGDLRQAAALLDKAARYAASPEDAEALRDQSKKLTLAAEFNDQVAAGEKAMNERRWKDAQTAWAAALKLKPDHEQTTALLKRARSNELADEALELQKNNDTAGALAKLKAAQQADPGNEAVGAAIREIEARLASIKDLADNARRAESASDWKTAEAMWAALVEQDPKNTATYEARVNNARFEQLMANCKASLAEGNLQEALRHARAAQAIDPSGGQRAQGQIRDIEQRMQEIAQAKQRAAAVDSAMAQANAMAAQGQFEEAAAAMAAAVQADPSNGQLLQMKQGLEAVAAVQRGYKRLEGYRQDAESAVQNAYANDKDKKILAMVEEVQSWQPRLAQGRTSAQAAWQGQRFEELAAQSEAMKSQAREMGQLFSNLAAVFHGKAASAAKPKANIGGMVGGISGIGNRSAGFGSVGANADVGDNQKKAGIFDGTANTLERCAGDCRNLAD